MELETMSRAKLFIPVIVTSFICGIFGPVLSYYLLSSFDLSTGSRLMDDEVIFILYLSPILISIPISLISGYWFTKFESGKKKLSGKTLLFVFSLTTATYFISAVITTIVILESRDCSGYKCGHGLEPLLGYIVCIPIAAIFALINGLFVTSFFSIGMLTMNYQYVKNQ
jgi:hypothetical protein